MHNAFILKNIVSIHKYLLKEHLFLLDDVIFLKLQKCFKQRMKASLHDLHHAYFCFLMLFISPIKHEHFAAEAH